MFYFFKNSEYIDYFALRPLSHICTNWELTWDYKNGKYLIEENSFAEKLNHLIEQLENTNPSKKYYENEDFLAEYLKKHLNWPISKKGKLWVCGDYEVLLEHGEFGDIDELNLMKAASGRILAANKLGQYHFDEMEEGQQRILASVISILLCHKVLCEV
jgi:hypothetical protein